MGTVVLLAALAAGILVLVFAMRNWTSLAKARKLKNPFPANAETIAAGSQIYTNHCRSCHGQYGDGKGEKAAELSTEPGDFTDRAKMDAVTDGELYWQVTKGRLPMPSFAEKLNEQQRWEAVDYIRTFAGNARP